MITKETIEKFFEPKKIAIAGASRNPKKFGCVVFKELKNKGYEVYPVNPNAEKIEGDTCYKNIKDIPEDVTSILILTPKEETDKVLTDSIEKGFKNIWVQQYSETNETIRIAEEYDKEIIHHKCVFMFAEPITGFHKFHRGLVKLFGGLPK